LTLSPPSPRMLRGARMPCVRVALTQGESGDCLRLLESLGATLLVPWASAGTRPRRSPSRLEGPRHQPSAL
jgi:hypothetical protein